MHLEVVFPPVVIQLVNQLVLVGVPSSHASPGVATPEERVPAHRSRAEPVVTPRPKRQWEWKVLNCESPDGMNQILSCTRAGCQSTKSKGEDPKRSDGNK